VTAKTVLLVVGAALILLAVGLAAMRNKQKQGNAASQAGTFSVLQGNLDGHPMFAMIDMGLRDSPERERVSRFSLASPLP